jgi:mannose-1-phosphate guanylyltransferase
VATLGLDNLIIADTKDALLVCLKNRTQDIKKIVEILKRKDFKKEI